MSESSERLKAARSAKGFATATDAARAHGWKEATYLGHENGTRGMGRAAPQYAKAFGVTVGWLLNGEGVGPSRSKEPDDAVDDDALQAIALEILQHLGRLTGAKALKMSRLIVRLSAAEPAAAKKIMAEMLAVASS